MLGSRLCLESNGFFGYDPPATGTLSSYSQLAKDSSDYHFADYVDHWSRFVIKQTYKTLRPRPIYIPRHSFGERIHDSSSVQHGWEWYEMDFFVHWQSPGTTTIICFNAPEKLRTLLRSALVSSENGFDYMDPFSLFSYLSWELLTLYDTSIWSLRNHICEWEAVCNYSHIAISNLGLQLSSTEKLKPIIHSCTKSLGI